jgi:hypothetical protein
MMRRDDESVRPLSPTPCRSKASSARRECADIAVCFIGIAVFCKKGSHFCATKVATGID